MPEFSLRGASLRLSEQDKRRLEAIAPLFEVEVGWPDPTTCQLRLSLRHGVREAQVPARIAHLRLLAEIASRATRWVYFNLETPARDSLLGLPDAKLARVAELYRRWLHGEDACEGCEHRESCPNRKASLH
jgi:hypothetical protein